MEFNFTVFTPDLKEAKSYPFVSINKSQYMGVSMPLTREFKNRGWKYCTIGYDNVAGVLKLAKSNAFVPEATEVCWQYIRADLRPVMPRGRYEVFKRTQNTYFLVFQE